MKLCHKRIILQIINFEAFYVKILYTLINDRSIMKILLDKILLIMNIF